MRLKKIIILGFKSFADKVIVEFPEGITAVVGPNGCGKSNISDAFRWVLGEQSAKSMRGGHMQDVIFAGTANRKPLNFAEVTIVLTDIQGQLPIDYEEVAVTRRLHRSGESEYLINGKKARLKDVQNLFLDSGMGKNAFAIFEQGKIDQVINNSPLERRYIFEEASGILRFLQRKREALRKFEQTEQNMDRVKDIHAEVERQIVVLEEQAEKARTYKEHRSELEALEKGVFRCKWEKLEKKHSELCNQEQDKKEEVVQAHQRIVGERAQLQKAKLHLSEREKELRVRQEEVFQARSDKEIQLGELHANQQRQKDISVKEKQWREELKEIEQKCEMRQIEIKNIRKKQEESAKALGALDGIRQAQRERVHTLDESLIQLREQQQGAQKELLKTLQEESRTESDLKQNIVRLESNQDREKQLKERQESVESGLKSLLEDVQIKKKRFEETSQQVAKEKATLAQLEMQLSDIEKKRQEAKKELHGVQQEMREIQARQKALQRLREAMEGFSIASKRLLNEASDPKSLLYCKLKGLYEYFKVKKGGEQALSMAMRPYAQTLVVETEQDLNLVIKFAQEHGLKDFSLICLECLCDTKAQKKLPSALQYAKASPLADHFLKNVYLADTMEEVLGITDSGIEVWSKEAFIDRHQVLFFSVEGENNVFLREAELDTLAQKLQELDQTQKQQEQELNALVQAHTQLHTDKQELEKSVRQGEMRRVEENFAWQRASGDLEKAEQEKKHLVRDLEACHAIFMQLSEKIAALKDAHNKAQIEVTHIQEQSASLSKETEEKLEQLRGERITLQEKESAYHQASDTHRKAVHALNVLEVQDTESKQLQKRLQDELASGRKLHEEIQKKNLEFEQEIQEKDKTLSVAMAAYKEFGEEIEQMRKHIEGLDAAVDEKQKAVQELEQAHYQFGIQVAKLESSRQALETELYERYQLTKDDLDEKLEMPLESAERKVRQLRNQMEEAGDVNMTSIEEFEKNKQRYEFLNRQLDDLRHAKQELIEIITQLDSESRKVFKETFEKIRTNFKKNFGILFRGGEADLSFTEAEDILDAGIEITAKPPSKKMQSIQLMSGGEKCLTALALLFAIFEVKPSPFCILDEIDAPLDDANVERFVNVVKQFVDRCQFIVITHNKRTMAVADVLFGVSMQEKGVSRLLSIAFSDKAKPEPVLV